MKAGVHRAATAS